MVRHWSLWGALGLILLLGGIYSPVLVDLAAQWSIDTTFGYGYFIPAIVAYLVWERRHKMGRIVPESSWWGYGLFLFGLGALVVGRVGGIALVARGSLILVLFGLVLFLRGWHMIRLLAFPLAFLAIMIPVPLGVLQHLTWPLQLFTARFSTEVLSLAGYPVLLDGIYIELPTARLAVTDACSGFRSLISLGATGVLLAYATQDRWSNRALLVTAVVPIAILSNAIRVTLNILFGIYAGTFHVVSGWVVFVVATSCLMVLAALLARRIRPEAHRAAGAVP